MTISEPPWAAGTATGVGSLPGTDAPDAVRLVLDELPDLPHLPELPARGAGADLLGRGAAMLTDLHVDLQPAGWRLVSRAGREEHRATDFLSRDLDALEELAADYVGPLKLQCAGPWTLAAGIELPRGDKALADPGAVRDLAAALADGLTAHVADVQRRVPRASLLVQLDEPLLPAVLAGHVRTASGFGSLRAVPRPEATDGLRAVLTAVRDAGAAPIVHCCARDAPIALFAGAGAQAVSVDLSMLTGRDDDAVGEAVEAGIGLLLGVVPGADEELSDLARTVQPVRTLWRRLGFPAGSLATSVVVTPACGLAGASPRYARAALRRCREVGRVLLEDPEG